MLFMNNSEFSSYFDEGRFADFHKDYPNFDFNEPIDNMPASKTYFQRYVVSKPYSENMKLAIEYMIKHGADLETPMNVSGYNTTLLMYAITKQNILLAKTLIDNNASLTATYGDGTIIHYIVQNTGHNYLFESVKKSLEKSGLDLANIKDKFGNTPLMTALRAGNFSDTNIYVRTLLDCTSDIRAVNFYGENALHIASGFRHSYSAHAERLLARMEKDHPEEMEIFVNKESNQFHRPLDFAVSGNPHAMISLLLRKAKHGSDSKVVALSSEMQSLTAIEALVELDPSMLHQICVDIDNIHKDNFGKPYFPKGLGFGKKDEKGLEKLEFHIPTEEDILEEYTRMTLDEVTGGIKKDKDNGKGVNDQLLAFLEMLKNKDRGNVKLFEYILDEALNNGLKVSDRALHKASNQYTAYPKIIEKLVQQGANPAPTDFLYGSNSGMTVLTKIAMNAVMQEKRPSVSKTKEEIKTYQDMGFGWKLKDAPNNSQNPFRIYLVMKPDLSKKDLQYFEDVGAPIESSILFDMMAIPNFPDDKVKDIVSFFSGKVDFNQKDKEGMTILDRVAKLTPIQKAVVWADALVSSGANPSFDPDFTALSACFLTRNRDLAQRWASKVNISASLVGALMWEGNEKTEDLVNRRLKSINEVIEDFKADELYGVDSQGVSPLMAAVFTDNVGAVQSLLAIGVDPKKVPSVENEGELYTVMDIALDNGVSNHIINMLKDVQAPTSREGIEYDSSKEIILPSKQFSASELFSKALEQSRQDGLQWIERKADITPSAKANPKTTKLPKP